MKTDQCCHHDNHYKQKKLLDFHFTDLVFYIRHNCVLKKAMAVKPLLSNVQIFFKISKSLIYYLSMIGRGLPQNAQ